MTREIGARTQIALVLYTSLNVALFTVGVYVVMLLPKLNDEAGYWIALVVGVSAVISAPIAWCLSACLCGERWRKKMVATPSPLANAPSRDF